MDVSFVHLSFACLHVCVYASKFKVIVGVSSNQAFLGYLITVHHLCAVLLYVAR